MYSKKLLIPHQYYYPNMNFIADRATDKKRTELFNAISNLDVGKKATIYVHIPFCNSKCAFCSFDKEYNLDEMEVYVNKVVDEIKSYANLVKDKYQIQSIHFGGGTPTLLPAILLQRIIDCIKENYNLAEDAAIDIEGSATTLYRDDIIDFILFNKITRVSFGVQSFDQRIRQCMNMKATREDVFYTLDILKKNGIISFIDVLYGYPDFGVGDLKKIFVSDIKTAIDADVGGIEFGQMYPFKNQLEKIVKDNNLRLPTSSEIIEMIELGTEMMTSAGYTQTTYSGFTKKGKIILETSYFGGIDEMPDCIACGCGAFGNIAGIKYRNVSYNLYMEEKLPCYSQIKKMTKEQIENMQIVGFPKVLVLNKALFKTETIWDRFRDKFYKLIAEGYVIERENYFELTKLGKNYIDNIYWDLLEDSEKSNIEKYLSLCELEV